jgi:hypothetical protein
VLNESLQVDSGCLFVLFFKIIFFLILSFNTKLVGSWASWFVLICFPRGYLGFMIEIAGFRILILIKSSYFFIWFLRGFLGLMIRVTSPSPFDLLFIGLSLSHNPGSEFDKLTQLTLFFFVFFSISSFNIVFD